MLPLPTHSFPTVRASDLCEARKAGVEIVAQIMVADARPHRKGAARKGGDQPAIAVVVAAVGDVAGGEQQVGAVRPLDQHVEHLVEPLPVIFGRIVKSEEQTSELTSLMRISYAVFCLKKKT